MVKFLIDWCKDNWILIKEHYVILSFLFIYAGLYSVYTLILFHIHDNILLNYTIINSIMISLFIHSIIFIISIILYYISKYTIATLVKLFIYGYISYVISILLSIIFIPTSPAIMGWAIWVSVFMLLFPLGYGIYICGKERIY